jgi:hypothetical protein
VANRAQVTRTTLIAVTTSMLTISRALLLATVCAAVVLASARAQDAATLRARHDALREQLADNPFGRPLYLDSSQSGGDWKGEVSAAVEHPFSTVARALGSADHWCEILILQTNIKYCEASQEAGTASLSVYITRGNDDPLESAYRTDFRFKVIAARDDYFHLALSSPDGPLGTRNYRIELEAVPLGGEVSFIHLSYSYSFGLAARLATRIYLATTARDKVGFSVVAHRADGSPVYVDGMRGMIERNTMRYYLAIEAYLGSFALPPAVRQEKSLRDWHAGLERHPRQLLDIPREDYLEMKRREVRRQPAAGESS